MTDAGSSMRAFGMLFTVICLLLILPVSLVAQITNFRTQTGIPGMPVLSASPAATSVGGLYANSTDRLIYKYNGTQWIPIGGSITANVSISPNPVLYKGQVVSPEISYIYSGGVTSTCSLSGSTYTWYRANDAAGTGKTVIASGTGNPIPYPVVAGDVTKYIGLGVTPTSACNVATFEIISWKQVSALTPSISAVNINGLNGVYAIAGRSLTASFTGYACAPVLIPGDVGANCSYQWYYATDGIGTGKTAISGKTSSAYTVSYSDGYTAGKYIAVGVTPVASNGETGTEKVSTWYLASTLVPAYSSVALVGLTGGRAQNTTTLAALKGAYSVTPAITGTEGMPTYKWYYATSATGTGKTAITGQTAPSHTVNINGGYGYNSDSYYLAVGITPVTTTGETGTEVLSTWARVQLLTAPDGTPVYELVSPTGRVWMDRNLGASRAATSSTDYLAYGSLYQWCRAADGHEKMTWTSSTTGTPVNGTTTMLSATSTPGHSLFITTTSSSYNWMSTALTNGNLWWNGTVAGTNSPCPTGYHVPTLTEWNAELALFAGNGGNNATGAYNLLKLVTTPFIRFWSDGSPIVYYGIISGHYWSSSCTWNTTTTYGFVFGYTLNFDSGNASMSEIYCPANGMNVRCIKN